MMCAILQVYSDYELQDEDYSDVVLDAPEVMLLAALRYES